MANEKMKNEGQAKEVQSEKVLLPDPFGCVVPPKEPREVSDKVRKAHKIITKYGLEVDPETHRTKIVVAEEIDLQQLVDSYKEECGIEAAMRLIKLGRARPEDFADDGKHGVDATNIPTFAGDALKVLQPGIDAGKQLREELGIPDSVKLNEDNLESLVSMYVEKKFSEIAAKKEVEQSAQKGAE